jgi:hypothetical protein
MSERFTVEVTLDDDAVPDDEETRERAERAAGEALGSLIESYTNIESDGVEHTSAGFGHEYAYISGRCPECGAVTKGASPEFAESSAAVPVQCNDPDCEWWGYETYRLIDLEYGGDEPGAVAQGKRTPSYVSYPSTEERDE